MSVDATTFDFEGMAREAVDKAERSRNPVTIEPGTYETVLDHYAIGDMLEVLAIMGLSAVAQREQRGPLAGHLGERICDERITIVDDPSVDETMRFGFDFEGQPIQRVGIIENGVAKGVVYDSFNALLEGKPNTGHALPAPNTWGPIPIHLSLQRGTSSVPEMIKSVERGIYVTRFHYTNVIHPVKAIFTGMTRDGTFLIENGEITRPVRNLRFVQGIFEALNSVKGVGREWYLGKHYIGSLAPAIHVGTWAYTGVQREA
jgi:predicted Zn-dependent protease